MLPPITAAGLTERHDGFRYANLGLGGELYRVDPFAPAIELFGSGSYGYRGDLAADPTDPVGDLFGSAISSTLLRVSVVDGSQTIVGRGVDATGLAFSADGRLWGGAIEGWLYEIDPLTGVGTFVSTLPFSVYDLASGPIPEPATAVLLAFGAAILMGAGAVEPARSGRGRANRNRGTPYLS